MTKTMSLIGVLLMTAAVAQSASELKVSDVVAAGGGKVVVPLRVTVADDGPLSKGDPMQALAFRVRYTPAEAVKGVVVRRAGVLAQLTPVFEATPSLANTASYVASFNAANAKVQLLAKAGEEGDVVAEIEVTLADGLAAGTRVDLVLEPEFCVLSNQFGNVIEMVQEGTLSVEAGSITVGTRSAQQPPARIEN